MDATKDLYMLQETGRQAGSITSAATAIHSCCSLENNPQHGTHATADATYIHLLLHLVYYYPVLHQLVSYSRWHHSSIKDLPKRICSCYPTPLTEELLPADAVGLQRCDWHAAHVLPYTGCMLPDATESAFTLQHLPLLNEL